MLLRVTAAAVAAAAVVTAAAVVASATGTATAGRRPARRARPAVRLIGLVGSAGGIARNGVPSFEDAFEAELVSELGDLGPGAVEAEGRSSSGGDRRPPRGRSRRR